MIAAIIILGVLLLVSIVLNGLQYNKLSVVQFKHDNIVEKKDADYIQQTNEHETEMKELELLFTSKIKDYDRAIDEYQDYILKFQKYYNQLNQIIKISDAKLKSLDHRGVFSSDDEIGFFFKNVKEIQNTLNEFDFTKPELEVVESKPSPIKDDGTGIIEIPFETVKDIMNQ